jgi:hypothetical protein
MNKSEHYFEQLRSRDKSLPHFACERCGRTIGEEILTCPDRPQGACPYLVKDLRPIITRAFSAFITVFSTLVLLLSWYSEYPFMRFFGRAICALLIFAGLWGTLQTRTLLYNPASKLKWKRTAILGITLQRTLIPGGKPLQFDLPLSQPLLFPPSFIKLSEAGRGKWTLGNATNVFRGTLIGLLARRVLQVQECPKYVAGWREEFRGDQNVYMLTAGQEFESVSIDGELEKQIILVVSAWMKKNGVEELEWPEGPPIYQLVRAVFKSDVSSPERWVLDLVARDAVLHGWRRIPGGPQKREQLSAAQNEQLESEITTFNRLAYQLGRQQPGFSAALDHEIERAIRSREYQQHYEP